MNLANFSLLSPKWLSKTSLSLVISILLLESFLPLTTFAAATSSSQGSDLKNALDTVGTKANRLKTIGSSGVDDSTGAFTYSYPFAVPKGRMDMEPSLAISYNSQAGENSMVGYGFTLAIPSIDRTSKFGTDKMFTDTDSFVSSLGGELVRQTPTGNTYLQKYDDGSYQLYTLTNNIWTLTDRSGNIYTYGATVDSRLSDTTGALVSKSYLTSVKDVFGNQVKYYYEKKDGMVYPKEIVYTVDKAGAFSNRIVFEREARPDSETSYRNGFLTTSSDRVKGIKAYTDGTLVAQLDLTYTAGQNGTRSLLSSIRESRMGTDGFWSSIPETKFGYEKGNDFSTGITWVPTTPGQVSLDITGDAKPEMVSTLVPSDISKSYTILDVNGDYLPDMYGRFVTSYGWMGPMEAGAYRKNTGGSFTDLPATTYNFPASASMYYSNSGSAGWVSNIVTVADLNADGLQDLLSYNPSLSSTSSAYLSNGKGFDVSTDFSLTDLDSLKGDFNGDGLIDKVADYTDPTDATKNGKYVYFNNSKGWNTTPDMAWKIPTPMTWKNSMQQEFDLGVRFMDANGDGLVDIVRNYNSVAHPNYAAYYSQWMPPYGTVQEIYLNTGKGFGQKISANFGTNYFVNHMYNLNNQTLPITTFPFTTQESLNTKKVDVMKSVTGPLGSTVDVIYSNTTAGNLNPNLPMNISVVDEIRETEVLNNLVESTKYTYEGGKMYYDENNIRDRRLAGFKKVTITKGPQKTVKYFHQGDGDDASLYEHGDSIHLIGKVFFEEAYGGTFKYGDTATIYGTYEYSGQIYRYTKQVVSTDYDPAGGKISKATTYDYDLASRLPKTVINYGEVKYNPSTMVITDVGEDLVRSVMISTNKRPQRFLSEEKYDVQGKFLDKTVNFYDDLPFGYTEKGLLTETRNYSSPTQYVKTRYTYNPKGLLEKTIDHYGNTTTQLYDTNDLPSVATNALGQSASTSMNKVLGVATFAIDPNGKMVDTAYDGFGNVKRVRATSPKTGSLELVSASTIVYGTGMTETQTIYAEGVAYKTVDTQYDSFGRNVSAAETVGGGSVKTVKNRYNTLGQVESSTYPYDRNGLLTGYNAALDTKFFYDDLGRVVKTKQGDLESNMEYFVSRKRTYDNTAEKHAKSTQYDSAGNVIAVTEETTAAPLVTKYRWNILGNMTQMEDAEGNVRNYSYDSEGKLLRQEDLHKKTDTTFGVYTYTYDAIGSLLSKTDPSKNTFTYTYDALFRPLTEANAELKTTYTYDTCLNGVGLLCQVSNADYTQTLAYLKSGQTATETKVIDPGSGSGTGSQTFTNRYTYDALGQMTQVTLPDASTLNYTYDQNGKQKSVSLTRTVNGVAQTTNVVNDAKYNIDGTSRELSYANGTRNCYNYSTNNGAASAPRLSDIYVVKNGTCDSASPSNPATLYSQNLSYFMSGLLKTNTEKYAGETSNTVSTFAYDELMRLTSTARVENSQTTSTTSSYSPIGNILTETKSASPSTAYNLPTTNYSYDGSDYKNPHAASLIGTTRMAYDLNGNVLDDGKNTYNWTKKNTLKKVESPTSTAEYTYDIGGERIKSVITPKTGSGALSNGATLGPILAQSLDAPTFPISEKTYDELALSQLASQNKIAMLFELANDSDYVKTTCTGSSDGDCTKKAMIVFVAGFLYDKYAIKLSATTLEESYAVYREKLTIPINKEIYEKVPKGNLLINANGTNLNCTTGYYQPYSWYTPSEQVCSETFYFQTNVFLNPKAQMLLRLNTDNAIGKTGEPIRVTIQNFANGYVYSTEQDVLMTKQDQNGAYEVDVSPYLTFLRTNSNNGTANFNAYIQIKYHPTVVDANRAVLIKNSTLVMGEFIYKNTINDPSAILPSVTDTVLLSDVFNQGNKPLAGAVHAEKKILSLFPNARLISQATFTELQSLGINYTNLVIYDRLIDYSFTPYFACSLLTDDGDRYLCEKVIFSKYLFSIVKYEKDKDLSPFALDEVFDAMRGQLTVPNNPDEYKIRETKNYSVTATSSTSHIVTNYGSAYYPNSATNCEVGSITNTIPDAYFCDLAFTLPSELTTRKAEVSAVKLQSTFAQGKLSMSPASGTWLTVPYTPLTLSVAAKTGNSAVVWDGYPNTALSANTDPSLTSPPATVDVSTTNTFDVTKMFKAFANGEVTNYGVRLLSSSVGTLIASPALTLAVTYARDADQVSRSFFTPLVTNPKDTDVEADVLRVLARIDRTLNVAANTIISQTTYNEIKPTTLRTNADVTALFDQNEHLRKDETLAAVFQSLRAQSNVSLTREALEELYMVWQGQLSMPVEEAQYGYVAPRTVKYTFDRSKWNPYTTDYNNTATHNNCTAYTYPYGSAYCSLQPEKNTDPYMRVTTAKLTFNAPSISSGAAVTVDSLKSRPADNTKLSNLPFTGKQISSTYSSGPLVLDVTPLYSAYQTPSDDNGIVIRTTQYATFSDISQLTSTNTFIEYTLAPAFTIFDRTTLENLSVVNGVNNVRDLTTDDITIKNKAYLSPETLVELASAGITKKADLAAYSTKTTITHMEKLAELEHIYLAVKQAKNISLTREALEEIYYLINGKLGFKNSDFDTGLNPNLALAYYRLNGAAATDAKKQDEASTAKLQETNTASTAGRSGETDGAYAFTNPSSNKLTLPTPISSTSATFSLWTKANQTGALLSFSNKDTVVPANSRYISIGIGASGPYAYLTAPNGYGSAGAGMVSSTANIIDNKWHKIDVVLNTQATGISQVYVDGALLGQASLGYAFNFQKDIFLGVNTNWYTGLLSDYFTGAIDDVKVYNTTLSGAKIASIYADDLAGKDEFISIQPFNRSSLGLLDPIDLSDGSSVPSANQARLEDNLVYTSVADDDVKIMSTETRSELLLVGMSTKTQLDGLFSSAPSALTTKDAKLYYFYKSLKDAKNYALSREALEEAWLVNQGKLLFAPVSIDGANITEANTYAATKPEWKMSTLTWSANPNNTPTATITATTSSPGVCNAGQVSGPSISCEVKFTPVAKTGYMISGMSMSFDGGALNNLGSVALTLNGTSTLLTNSLNLKSLLAASNIQLSPTVPIILRFTAMSNYNTFWGMINFKVTTLYTPITKVFDRSSFAQLSDTSPITDLQAAYNVAMGLAGTVVSSQWQVASNTGSGSTASGSVVTGSGSVTSAPVSQGGQGVLPPSPSPSPTPTVTASGSTLNGVVTTYYPSSMYEVDSLGNTTINIPFNGQVVATVFTPSPSQGEGGVRVLTFLHTNYLGSPILTTNATGAILSKTKYDAWGNLIPNQPLTTNSQPPVSASGSTLSGSGSQLAANRSTLTASPFGFTGHRLDPESSLTYAHARYYNSSTHIWLSEDPAFYSFAYLNKHIANPQSWNSYNYVGNNPVNFSDPFGLDKVVVANGTDLSGKHQGADMFKGQDGATLRTNTAKAFGVQESDVLFFSWSGDDNSAARSSAARRYNAFVKKNVGANEKLYAVGYSHGGNVIIQATNLPGARYIDKFVTIATPVRDDYIEKAGMIGYHLQIYSTHDWVQIDGGYDVFGIGAYEGWTWHPDGTYSKDIFRNRKSCLASASGCALANEYGTSGRTFDNANTYNYDVGDMGNDGPIDTHTNMWNNQAIWGQIIDIMNDDDGLRY